MPYTVGNFGLRTLVPLGKLMLSVYTTMFLFVFVALGLIARLYGFSLWKSLEYIKVEILLVLGTSSSEAALPRMMDKLEKFGCAKPIVGLVIPTGYSFNLDGTSIYLSMATVFLAQVSGVDLTLGRELTVLGVLMLTSRGAAGVTGSGFIVLASSLSAMKIIPVTSIALCSASTGPCPRPSRATCASKRMRRWSRREPPASQSRRSVRSRDSGLRSRGQVQGSVILRPVPDSWT